MEKDPRDSSNRQIVPKSVAEVVTQTRIAIAAQEPVSVKLDLVDRIVVQIFVTVRSVVSMDSVLLDILEVSCQYWIRRVSAKTVGKEVVVIVIPVLK
mmetsp:Transcript_11111/g.32140  ORF Transcript_11111/g.32140 Transcript_11111/m.32140 type:complete len:97 (-) Transcript_11111:396-686(-)